MKYVTQAVAEGRGAPRLNYAVYRVLSRLIKGEAERIAVFVREQRISFMLPESREFKNAEDDPGFVGIYARNADVEDVIADLKCYIKE